MTESAFIAAGTFPIVHSDSVMEGDVIAKAFRINGNGGQVKYRCANGAIDTQTFSKGEIHQVVIKQIFITDTTATDIHGYLS